MVLKWLNYIKMVLEHLNLKRPVDVDRYLLINYTNGLEIFIGMANVDSLRLCYTVYVR